ncbi:hypothetical protein MXMO3_02978 [Maritalea myrionectae]|uniref:Uncharacterized protein n=1 Tax=Maritalea myrionectae TaxID=454601 RepID=A0A2R4MHZ1_9HYPH|nr:hypothetical protein [Maritalea myrionectae]AVX05486.1 hypothetical protein MXMO3_02978 [Maritalea myrionectae]
MVVNTVATLWVGGPTILHALDQMDFSAPCDGHLPGASLNAVKNGTESYGKTPILSHVILGLAPGIQFGKTQKRSTPADKSTPQTLALRMRFSQHVAIEEENRGELGFAASGLSHS